MKFSGLFFILWAIFFSGCKTTSIKFNLGNSAKLAPDSWASSKEAKAGVDEQWLARFKDKRLERLVEVALESNLDLKRSAAKVQRAVRVLRISRSELLPDLSTQFDASRRKAVFAGLPFGGGNTSSIDSLYGVSLDVAWELDVWGRIRAANRATLADLQSEELLYRAAKVSLIAQVAKAYFSAIEAEQQVKLAQVSLKTVIETEATIRERFESAIDSENGVASQLRLSQTDVATAKAALAERKGLAQQTKRQLEILLGQYPKGRLSVSKSLPKVRNTPPVGLPSGLLLRRPDVLAAERRYASSKSRIREAKLARFPQFNLTGSSGTSTTELKNVLNSDFGQWSIGANILQSILINGRLKAEVDSRKIAEDDASYDLQKTVLVAFGEVEEALSDEYTLHEREKVFREAVGLAKVATQAARDDYAGGTGDILTLLTAQSRETTIAAQYSTLRLQRLVNRVDLHLSLGGDYVVRKK